MAEKLFSEFPPLSTDAWKQQIEAFLKGKPLDSLNWRTLEGFEVFPVIRKEDLEEKPAGMPGEFPYRRGDKPEGNLRGGWAVSQDYTFADVEEAKAQLSKQELSGAFSVTLALGQTDSGAWRQGMPIYTPAQLKSVLERVNPESIALHLETGRNSLPVFASFLKVMQENGLSGGQLTGGIDNDPIRAFTLDGFFSGGEQQAFAGAAAILRHTIDEMPWFKGLNISLESLHEAGCNLSQQIAFGLSILVDYVERFEAHNISPAEVLGHTMFSFPAGTDFFPEMAKFRSFRTLFSRVCEGYNLSGKEFPGTFLHARTSAWEMGLYDSHTNLLRATTGAMSAILGGVDMMSVRAFDELTGGGGSFSGRIARNIQLMLRDESYLDKVLDPGGGSHYIEYFTRQLEAEAWKLFLELEQEGGFLAAFRKGRIQEVIEPIAEQKRKLIRTRRDSRVGVNAFPRGIEKKPVKVARDLEAAPPAQSMPEEIVAALKGNSSDILRQFQQHWPEDLPFHSCLEQGEAEATPLNTRIAGEAFEAIRARTEENAQNRPKVALLTFGDLKFRKARAGFAGNLLGCAGFALGENPHPEDLSAAQQWIKTSAPEVIVLCAADADYATTGLELLKQVREIAADARFILAGKPADETVFREAGIDHFIYLNMDAVSFLTDLQSQILP